ncbi:MAG: potassium transporter TrkG [Victivallaceae bacterium]
MTMNFIKTSQLYFIFSFAAIILLGTVILKMPFITHNGGSMLWIDALFTSTSAVCVTGLTTVNTSGFNLAGQLVILLLIQIGGLGIMTLTASVIVILGKNISFSNAKMISNISDSFPLKSVEGLLKTVAMYTFSIEAVGAGLLFYGFYGMNNSFFEALYLGVFHSISAFCNAGFSTMDTSLIGMSPFIKIVVSALIILGGLGIYVIYDLSHFRRQKKHFRIHTKLVLLTSFILIVMGTFGLKVLEYFENGSPISWLDAYFQSVTARTAGFNTVDLSILHPSSILIIIALMLIGASPGSTGGGMKTTTAALAFISIYNMFAGNKKVLLFKREVPLVNVLKSYAIMFTFIMLSIIGTILVSATSEATMQAAFFETASALATVGLSLGTSAQAGVACKAILIALMFVGRIGPFTIFLFLMSREKTSRLEYPEVKIIMG